MKLHRVDYLQVASLKTDAIRLLSSRGAKQQQKVVVGDMQGVLQLFSLRRGEPFIDFKLDLAAPINYVLLFPNNETSTEMIIVATAQTVQSFSTKGKPIFTLETNLVEPIQHLWLASKDDVIVANSYVYNHYHEAKEANYFLSTDRINSTVVLPLNKVPSLTPLLACQDATIYALRESAIRHRLPLDGIPSVLHLFQNDGGTSGEWVVFGTVTGQIGLVRCTRAGPYIQWTMQLSARVPVTSIDFYDVGETGSSQLILGRNDGFVEIYEVTVVDDDICPPTLVYSQNLKDSIAAVKGGVVGVDGFPEVLVATHQGWIFGLTSCESLIVHRPSEGMPTNRLHSQNTERRKQLAHLKLEVEQLEQKLSEATQIKYATTAAVRHPASLMKQCSIIANMNFVSEENVYYLSIESRVPINYCLVQCDTNVELSDIDRNLSILNVITSKGEGNRLLATFRCQTNATRLEMKLRCIERSSSDELRLYVCPSTQQSRCVFLKSFLLVCLCHHVRCQPFEWSNELSSPGRLTLSGGFSLADAHSWMASCFPNVPDKIPSLPADEEVQFFFRHPLWETFLCCRYRRGEITCESDNIAALSIVREFVSKEATVKNVQMNISIDVKWKTVANLLRRLHPQLMRLRHRRNEDAVRRALEEAISDQAAHGVSDWMTEELRKAIKSTAEDSSYGSSRVDEYQRFLWELFVSYRSILGHVDDRQWSSSLLANTPSTEALLEFFQCDETSTTF